MILTFLMNSCIIVDDAQRTNPDKYGYPATMNNTSFSRTENVVKNDFKKIPHY